MVLEMVRARWGWMLLTVGLSAADALTTLVAMTRYGAPELNPVAQHLMTWFGLAAAVVIAKALTMLAATTGGTLVHSRWPHYSRWYFVVICVMIAWTVTSNLRYLAIDAGLF